MNIYAASFLIPVGVILYTLSGGLKATFLASYFHTTIIFTMLVLFVVCPTRSWAHQRVYTRGLQTVSTLFPVAYNKGGSYLTMMSQGGTIFGIISIVGNFGKVFCDQSYW